MVRLAKAFNETNKTPAFFLAADHVVEVQDLDESVIRKVALYARTELTALAALFGGVVAQEIVKQTGKYTPISQWMHFDALEMVRHRPCHFNSLLDLQLTFAAFGYG